MFASFSFAVILQDKACAEISGDEGGTESSDTSDYETDSDAEREMEEKRRKVQEAIAEKDKVRL